MTCRRGPSSTPKPSGAGRLLRLEERLDHLAHDLAGRPGFRRRRIVAPGREFLFRARGVQLDPERLGEVEERLHALQRLAQVWLLPAEPDPRTVVPTAKIAMFWRLFAALPVALVVAITIDAVRVRAGDRMRDALPAVVGAVAIVCALQGLLVP